MVEVNIKLARKMQRFFLTADQLSASSRCCTSTRSDRRQGVLQGLREAEGAAVLPFIWLQMKIVLKVLRESDGLSNFFKAGLWSFN